MNFTKEFLAVRLGCSVEQIKAQATKNAAQLASMVNEGAQRGFTKAQLLAMQAKMQKCAS